MNNKKTAQISKNQEWVIIKSPYDQNFVSDIKQTFEYADRTYFADEKAWGVSRDLENDLRTLAQKYFELEDVESDINTKQSNTPQPPAVAKEVTLEKALDAIYKHIVHDVELMSLFVTFKQKLENKDDSQIF
jgi:hypothetical protein